MTAARRAGIASLAIACLFARGSRAVGNVCISGTCDISHPVYVNVYWDGSIQQWNQDAADASMTVARIDALTKAICKGAYFSQLGQYSVKSCSVGPSIIAGPICGMPPGDLDKAHDKLGDLGSCIASAHPELDTGRTILNVFVPPQIAPQSPDATFCHQGTAQPGGYGGPLPP